MSDLIEQLRDTADYLDGALHPIRARQCRRAAVELKQANAALHDIISGKADGCPECERHEKIALAALEVTDDEY